MPVSRRHFSWSPHIDLIITGSAMRDEPDPVRRADLATSMADWRAASCLAAGVAPDEIAPASGHEATHRMFLESWAQWARFLAEQAEPDGSHHQWVRVRNFETLQRWRELRPDLVARHGWPLEV